MNITQFRQIMGIFGLESTHFLSDKIFKILDENSNNEVKFLKFKMQL